MPFDLSNIAYLASVWALPVLLAITLHEAAHGFIAWSYGDDTAYKLGRVTMNPLKHIHPFGTILLPLLLIVLKAPFLFGYAKPVPIAVHRLRKPRRDMVYVAAAGPTANLILAAISALLFNLVPLLPEAAGSWLAHTLRISIIINLILAVLNLLPLPPLDGGRIAVGILPISLAVPLARLERYGIFILLAAFFLLPYLGRELGVDISVFDWLIRAPVNWLLPFFSSLAGLPETLRL
ncbi:site-2 protease family protein [Pelagibius sp.]|uniref:site-2 protease family protein n=1 Tax=Pelagibius sp. TaxID=1931238 RepID=UPI00262D0E6A|nr:site-2 protease family protein [Pelagibius sp.]